MTKQQSEIYGDIIDMAEKQVFFLKQNEMMNPAEIVSMYTGEDSQASSYQDAIAKIVEFNMDNAKNNGFVA